MHPFDPFCSRSKRSGLNEPGPTHHYRTYVRPTNLRIASWRRHAALVVKKTRILCSKQVFDLNYFIKFTCHRLLAITCFLYPPTAQAEILSMATTLWKSSKVLLEKSQLHRIEQKQLKGLKALSANLREVIKVKQGVEQTWRALEQSQKSAQSFLYGLSIC